MWVVPALRQLHEITRSFIKQTYQKQDKVSTVYFSCAHAQKGSGGGKIKMGNFKQLLYMFIKLHIITLIKASWTLTTKSGIEIICM